MSSSGKFLLFLAALLLGGCSLTGPAPAVIPPEKQKVIDSPAMHRATLRPYVVHGKSYTPTLVNVGDVGEGVASWYGPKFHGRKTSNGEVYNMYAMTAAHKTLPMNTVVKVTRKDTGKSTVVRVNDRGPFVAGRIIDLSFTAGKELGLDKCGTAPVAVEVLGFDGHISKLVAGREKESRQVAGFAVQVGSFHRKEGAEITVKEAQALHAPYGARIKTVEMEGKTVHKVLVTGFKSEAEARDFVKNGGIDGSFIIADD